MRVKLEHYSQYEKTIETLQEAIVKAGGCYMKRKQLLDMTFSEILEGFIPNNITFNIKYEGKY